jgi:hypothetical protein
MKAGYELQKGPRAIMDRMTDCQIERQVDLDSFFKELVDLEIYTI